MGSFYVMRENPADEARPRSVHGNGPLMFVSAASSSCSPLRGSGRGAGVPTYG